jgi:hypothetical protein
MARIGIAFGRIVTMNGVGVHVGESTSPISDWRLMRWPGDTRS